MRRNYRNLFMVGVMAFATCLTSCKKDEGPTLDITVNGSEELAEEIRSTSASFTLNTSGVDSVAYYVELGAASESDFDATVLYANAKEEGRVVPVADGKNTITVYSLEGNTEYTVFIVYAKDGKFVMKSKVFTTPAYDRIINVIESRKDGWKFHFNVPDTMTYMYAILPTYNYNAFRAYGWSDDTGFLLDGIRLTGPQTIEIKSGEDWYEEGDGGFYIHPGSAFTLMVAECDAEGNLLYEMNPNIDLGGEDDWGGEVWGPMAPATRAGSVKAPRMGEYTEEPWYTDDYYPTGLYARQSLLAALDIVESKVDMELVGKTERRIKIRCTADEDVQYVIAPMEKNEYIQTAELVTEDAMAVTLLENYSYYTYNGTQDFVIDDEMLFGIAVDSTYIISVVGIYAEDASVISYDTLHVTLTKSTLPAAELTITGCGNPNGEPTPNLVWFNVKSEAKNVSSAKHIANYTKEVVKELSQGNTYEDLLTYYGEYLTEEDIQAINSDEGLYLSLYSMEDADNTLIVAAFNEEDGMTVYTGESRSAALPTLPEAPNYSTLAEELKGDWTARIIRINAEYSYETWSYEFFRDTTFSVITLGETFDNSPVTFDETHEAYSVVYDGYFMSALNDGVTEEEAAEIAAARVTEEFAEYKKMVEKYEEKYKGQNYILGLGFAEAHTFATPWDLFCSTEYSAYDAEELFYAYGPKLFFQVQQDGSLQLLGDANMLNLPPVAAWGWYEFFVVGNNPEDENDAYDAYNGGFPVEISDDKNTLVIKGVENNGNTYYPAIGFYEWGALSYLGGGFRTIADIELTRGVLVEDEDAEVATRATKTDREKADVRGKNNRIKRTALPSVAMPKVKTVKMNYVPVLEKLQEKFNKYNERMSK